MRTEVIHPPRARVYWIDYLDVDAANWQWTIFHFEDRFGQRYSEATRWGACTRHEDALEIALAMLRKEMAEFWGEVLADTRSAGWVRRIPQ